MKHNGCKHKGQSKACNMCASVNPIIDFPQVADRSFLSHSVNICDQGGWSNAIFMVGVGRGQLLMATKQTISK